MSRKVYVEAEVEVLVPVKVKVEFAVNSDEDANHTTAIKRFLAGKTYSKADVTFGNLTVTGFGSTPISTGEDADLGEDLTEAVNEYLNGGDGFKSKLLDAKVIDSK